MKLLQAKLQCELIEINPIAIRTTVQLAKEKASLQLQRESYVKRLFTIQNERKDENTAYEYD